MVVHWQRHKTGLKNCASSAGLLEITPGCPKHPKGPRSLQKRPGYQGCSVKVDAKKLTKEVDKECLMLGI